MATLIKKFHSILICVYVYWEYYKYWFFKSNQTHSNFNNTTGVTLIFYFCEILTPPPSVKYHIKTHTHTHISLNILLFHINNYFYKNILYFRFNKYEINYFLFLRSSLVLVIITVGFSARQTGKNLRLFPKTGPTHWNSDARKADISFFFNFNVMIVLFFIFTNKRIYSKR